MEIMDIFRWAGLILLFAFGCLLAFWSGGIAMLAGILGGAAVLFMTHYLFGWLGIIVLVILGLLILGAWAGRGAILGRGAAVAGAARAIGWGFLPAGICFLVALIMLIYAWITGKWWAWVLAVTLFVLGLWLLCNVLPFCAVARHWIAATLWPKIKMVFGVLMMPLQWLYRLNPNKAKAIIIGTIAGLIAWWMYDPIFLSLGAWKLHQYNWKTFLWAGLTLLAIGCLWYVLPKVLKSFIKKQWEWLVALFILYNLFVLPSPYWGERWVWWLALAKLIAWNRRKWLWAKAKKGWGALPATAKAITIVTAAIGLAVVGYFAKRTWHGKPILTSAFWGEQGNLHLSWTGDDSVLLIAGVFLFATVAVAKLSGYIFKK